MYGRFREFARAGALWPLSARLSILAAYPLPFGYPVSLDVELEAGLSDRYVLERELGRGGTATVWLARDLKHDRLVALKVLRPELAATLGP